MAKSKMAESMMAEFLEIAIFQPIQVRFVSNLKLKLSLGLLFFGKWFWHPSWILAAILDYCEIPVNLSRNWLILKTYSSGQDLRISLGPSRIFEVIWDLSEICLKLKFNLI